MKTNFKMLFLLLCITLFITPFSGLPKLGSFLNFSTGIMQIRSPEFGEAELRLAHGSYRASAYLDSLGIPHIFAESDASASFMLGYLHARDRLFQMDLITRMMSANLAELVGDAALPSDAYWVHFEFSRRAKEYAEMVREKNPEIYARMQAYGEGVNRYINSMELSDLPEEYHLLDAKPRRWREENPFFLVKYMAMMLNHRKLDLHLQRVFNALPKHLVAQFYPMQEPYLETIIPELGDTLNRQETAARGPSRAAGIASTIAEREKRQGELVFGSNNWAVSGKKSASGEAILSNDMHLTLTLPAPWYEVHIKTPNKHVYGLSIPCSPVVVVGFNEAISWGLTNAHWDLVDYSEVAYTDSNTFLYGNESLAITRQVKELRLKNGDVRNVSLKSTEKGPIIRLDGTDYLVEWEGAKTGHEYLTFTKLEVASNWSEFLDALSHFTTPPQNFVFADTAGNIGLITNGKMPIKPKGFERGVFSTENSEARNTGTLAQAQLPQIYNPEKGFIASANQRQIYNSPHFFNGSDMAPPYRGKEISNNLRRINAATPADMRRIQADITDLSAADLLPVLLKELSEVNEFERELKMLAKWDYSMAKDLVAPTIYDQFRRSLFDEIRASVLKNDEIISPPHYVLITEVVRNDSFGELSRKDLMAAALNSALGKLRTQFGGDITTWTYGRYHQTSINHVLRIPAFSEPTFASDGSIYTPNVARGPHVTAGSSQRAIIHMTTPIRAWMNIAGGQSGRPSSPNFRNQIPLWKTVGLREVEFVGDKSELKKVTQVIHLGE